tara:strand:- start:213 stop:1388 length:1176 start_codon:yes stop_codon:yes gene_type:complete
MHQLVLNRQTKLLALLLIATFNVQASAESIGGVLEQSGSVAQIQRDRENIPAVLDESIASMDEVETKNGRLKIKFVDDTLVSLTEHTYMVIDEYVYDPNPSKSKMALNFVSGTARFATGGLGLVPRENIQIQTPTASIGIRGTDFTTTVDELGRSLVILLPDENCTDKVKLEEGCAPSGSITVTNDGGTQVLTEAYQAVMVSTFETIPTTPVVLTDLNLNMIDNMFIVSEPAEITVAKDEQIQELQGDAGLLDFNGLDADALEIESLEDNTADNYEFTELDINFLDVEFLKDLLTILEDNIDSLGNELDDNGDGTDRLIGTRFGNDPNTQFNSFAEYDGKIFLLRQISNTIGIKLEKGSTARVEIFDEDNGEDLICLNSCDGIYISITQNE